MSLTVGTQTTGAGTATSGSLTMPGGIADGDRMYAFVVVRLTATLAPPGGLGGGQWTIINSQRQQSNHTFAAFYRDKQSGDTGPFVFTWGGTSAAWAGTIVPVRPTAAINHVGVTNVDAVSDGTAVISAASAVSRSGLLLNCAAVNRGATTLTPNDGYTGLTEADNNVAGGIMLRPAHKTVSSTVPVATSHTIANGSTSTAAHIQIWEETAVTAADGPTTSDTATRTTALARTLTDAPTTSDESSRTATFDRPTTQTVTFSDTAVVSINVAANAADDALTLSDAAVQATSRPRVAADTPTTSDASSRVAALGRPTAQTVTFSDTAVVTLGGDPPPQIIIIM